MRREFVRTTNYRTLRPRQAHPSIYFSVGWHSSPPSQVSPAGSGRGFRLWCQKLRTISQLSMQTTQAQIWTKMPPYYATFASIATPPASHSRHRRGWVGRDARIRSPRLNAARRPRCASDRTCMFGSSQTSTHHASRASLVVLL